LKVMVLIELCHTNLLFTFLSVDVVTNSIVSHS
jgi:hypothetical protein